MCPRVTKHASYNRAICHVRHAYTCSVRYPYDTHARCHCFGCVCCIYAVLADCEEEDEFEEPRIKPPDIGWMKWRQERGVFEEIFKELRAEILFYFKSLSGLMTQPSVVCCGLLLSRTGAESVQLLLGYKRSACYRGIHFLCLGYGE